MTISKREKSRINTANAFRSVGVVFWTAEREALLAQRWQSGALVFDIAQEIGNGCTRNMVIAKARRMKLGKATLNRKRISERQSQAQVARRQIKEAKAALIRVSRETSEAAA